jgi:hypothetical protein
VCSPGCGAGPPAEVAPPDAQPGEQGARTPGTAAGTADALVDTLDLRSRAVADFLDGLVALRLLERDGSERPRRTGTAP